MAVAAGGAHAFESQRDGSPDPVPADGGTTNPPAISSPTTITVTLSWSAPGDDSLTGIASLYDLRYSTIPIDNGTWSFATPVANLPLPGAPGTRQSITLAGMPAALTYYFAIKTADERGNWSALSNVALHLPGTTGVGGADGLVAFSSPTPNPARTQTRFAFALPRAGHVEADVFDVSGRHVRTLASGEHAAGSGELRWDLTDDQGQPLQAGIYLVRAQLGASRFTRRVAVVR